VVFHFRKKNGKYLFIKVNDLNLAVNDKYIEFSENTIDEEDVKALGLKIYPPNTLIFPKVGMAIYTNKKRILARFGTFDNNLMGVIPISNNIDIEFFGEKDKK